MKKILFLMICCGFVLVSCAGTPTHIGTMTAQGKIKVDTADDNSYDYKVSILNYVEIGWDGNKKEDRLKAVDVIFKDKCKSIEVIGEDSIQTGKYFLSGDPTITYILKVKCNK